MAVRRRDEVAQDVERRRVGPMQVVEDEHDRRVGRRRLEERLDRVHQDQTLGIGGLPARCSTAAERGHEPGERVAVHRRQACSTHSGPRC